MDEVISWMLMRSPREKDAVKGNGESQKFEGVCFHCGQKGHMAGTARRATAETRTAKESPRESSG